MSPPTATTTVAPKRRFGIQPKNEREFFKTKPLYQKLFKAFPDFHKSYSDGEVSLSLENLAKFLGFNRYSLYRWCNGERMRASNARIIADKSEGKLSYPTDFIDHVL